MRARLESFFKVFNPFNWKFGIKLRVLVYSLLLLSFLLVTAVGLSFISKKLESCTYERLEQLAFFKRDALQKDYNKCISEARKLFSGEVIYDIQRLETAFHSYQSERYSSFSADSLKMMSLILKDYYESEIIEKTKLNTPDINEILPQRPLETVLQYTYIVTNKWPVGEKDKLFTSKDNTSYSSAHQSVHALIRSFARKFKINNVYLVDSKTGDIFYNLNKNIAFGTNLFDGPYKTTELAALFQKASVLPSGKFAYSDYVSFVPEQNKNVILIATPIVRNNSTVSVAILELTSNFFENILYDQYVLDNYDVTNINLIGSDNILRVNEAYQKSDEELYFNHLGKKSNKIRAVYQAQLKKEGAGTLYFVDKDKKSKSGLEMSESYDGEDLISYKVPVELEGFDWSLISFTPVSYFAVGMSSAMVKLLLLFVVLFIIAVVVTRVVINSIVRRLNRLQSVTISLSTGQNPGVIEVTSNDELGQATEAFNTLYHRIIDAAGFAGRLSQGDFTQDFPPLSEQDSFAIAFNTLTKELRKNMHQIEITKQQDDLAMWENNGIAQFNDLLRQSNNDIKALSFIIIEHLVEYLDANQGGVFLVEGESEQDKYISQVAAFAYDRRKYSHKRIEIGEGLIGNCYLEKKLIYLSKVPEDYLEITSGLGSSLPACLLIVPLINDKDVLGFIEIASFVSFEEHQIKFMEKLADNIAATFSTVKLNTRTAELLEESKRRANEITQQEEEMRQNMEEMQATQEELARLREEDERNRKELEHQISNSHFVLTELIDSISKEVIVKDNNGVIIMANKAACKRYNVSQEEIKGKLDAEVLDRSILESEKELDSSTLIEGMYFGRREESVGGSFVEYEIEKRLFRLPDTKDLGIITFWKVANKEE